MRMTFMNAGSRLSAVLCGLALVGTVHAGNPNRAGSAGGTQLLVNPWARSNGWSMANTARMKGVESMFGNVGGLGHVRSTEVSFASTDWLSGSGVKVNSFALGQKLGDAGVIGVSVTTIGFGDLPVTTVDQPEGGLGTFRPNQSNIGVSFSKQFSNSISGGLVMRVVSEAIANVRSSGICFDAGIQYVTGPTDNIHFGIALRNVGPAVAYRGDGLSVQGILLNNNEEQISLEHRGATFELPSLMNIGGAYDFNMNELSRLTLAGNFTSNSFTKDQFILGLEYAFRKMFHVRGGYLWEEEITKREMSQTVFSGPSAGLSIDLPFGKEKESVLAIDYAYRATYTFNGIHSIGLRLSL